MARLIESRFWDGGFFTQRSQSAKRLRRRVEPALAQNFQRLVHSGSKIKNNLRRFRGRGGISVVALEGEDLGFVVLDGAEEGVVVGGAVRGDFFQDEI